MGENNEQDRSKQEGWFVRLCKKCLSYFWLFDNPDPSDFVAEPVTSREALERPTEAMLTKKEKKWLRNAVKQVEKEIFLLRPDMVRADERRAQKNREGRDALFIRVGKDGTESVYARALAVLGEKYQKAGYQTEVGFKKVWILYSLGSGGYMRDSWVQWHQDMQPSRHYRDEGYETAYIAFELGPLEKKLQEDSFSSF